MAKVEHEQKLFGTPALSRAWLDAVVKHPLAYIQHRLTFFKTFLFGSHLGDVDHRHRASAEDHFRGPPGVHDVQATS